MLPSFPSFNLDMPLQTDKESSLPFNRTGHACVQCRQRKQKCGGFTHGVKCRRCTTRKVKCSFEDEFKDPRYNPYLRIRSTKSPSPDLQTRASDAVTSPSASTRLIPGLTAPRRRALPATLPTLAEISTDDELSKQLELLKSQMADMERRLSTATTDPAEYMGTPLSHAGTSFLHPLGPGPENAYLSPPLITDGPLKTLNSFQNDDPVETESHDPILQSTLTEGEAHVMFRLYFTNCHPNAPFLDVNFDSDLGCVRPRSLLLFLAILAIGGRFWSASSKTTCWLHPRYAELVRLLDAEVMRVTLRPRPDDQKLETVQALLLCAHWMSFDVLDDVGRYRSRFSEGGAWQCLGLAIRWATSLALERSCHLSIQHPNSITREDMQKFRTMLYLTESDHYLALSARRPSYLDPKPLNDVLSGFLQCKYTQSTDVRLASLFRVAYGAHFGGCRPTTIESVEAFNKDVELIERSFQSSMVEAVGDTMSQHFPFISLHWYRLSYACAFLDTTDPTQRTGKALTWAIEWASQILIHLSKSPSTFRADKQIRSVQLEPDPSIVNILSFAIDHYFVVISYAAFFMVNSWLGNFIDLNLQRHVQHESQTVDGDASTSLLFRLVDVAARTLEEASPPEGHLARRYVPLLRGMTGIILSGKSQPNNTSTAADTQPLDLNGLPDQSQNLGEDLWEMWQQAGLESLVWPGFPDDVYEG